MKKRNNFLRILSVTLLFTACTKNLDRTPLYGLTDDKVYANEAGYASSLAKVYGGLALTGNTGPDGSGDLGGIDEGFSSYLRNYFNLQELSTDEAVIGWNDQTIKNFHTMSWTPTDNFLRAMYSRLFYQITLANSFIAQSSDAKVSARGITGTDADKVKLYRLEARFLRAFSYWHALDLFGNVTFVTENDPIGAFTPPQKSRADLFAYLEKELLDIETTLPAPRQNEYARVDKAAVWMLLANLYLNAQVYTGTAKNTEAVTWSKKVIDTGGYTLEPNYRNLFMADNNLSKELIFVAEFDGIRTRTWGGTTYLVHGPIGGDMAPADYGVDNAWGGLRTTKALVSKFADPSGATDKRANFQSAGQTLEIQDIGNFRDGYGVKKWSNKTSKGANGSNLTWTDTDYPVFRLAEAYMIAAEAILRGGAGGTNADALTYVNLIRRRAYGNNNNDLTTLNLQNIIDERAREFYWEAKRRTDLIRFNQFTTADYLWPFKGNVPTGKAVESFRNLYPIPTPEINTNPNLVQNAGYN